MAINNNNKIIVFIIFFFLLLFYYKFFGFVHSCLCETYKTFSSLLVFIVSEKKSELVIEHFITKKSALGLDDL